MHKYIQSLIPVNANQTSRKESNTHKKDRNGRSLRCEHLENRRMLATLTVNVLNDGLVNANDGFLTIREAIAYVNQDEIAQADLIQIESPETLGDPDVVDKILFDPSLFDNTLPDDDGIRRVKTN